MRILTRALLAILLLWAAGTVVAGFGLPGLLLQVPLPARTEAQREEVRRRLAEPGGTWTSHPVAGGEGVPLELWWLHRPSAKGVVIYAHGFGDDAWGTAPRARDLPDWDALVFTFRGRDRDPQVACTLGAWERWDLVAAVRFLESRGVPRRRIVIGAVSQGAGATLLALRELEHSGGPLGGALLESPWKDMHDAARNHLRGTLGRMEPLALPAERLALWRGGALARFRAAEVSPLEASRGLRTPVALLAGDADEVTPLAGVRAIAARHPDLTVVPGGTHGTVAGRLPGGWSAWAQARLRTWGLE